jgi:sugar lactone lactonase YvrE
MYVSDGYGNARVHRFSKEGELLQSWGEPGDGPGQFNLPHSVWAHTDGRVFVCDRENDRIQIFSPDGEYLSEWTDTRRPTHLVFDSEGRAYVSELWWQPGQTSSRYGPATQPGSGRVSVYDRNGAVLVRWGGDDPTAPGSFAAPHGLAVDARGDFYFGRAFGAERPFGVARGQALVLQVDGKVQGERQVAGDSAGLPRGLAFRPVEVERQTNHHPFGVKAPAQLGDLAQQLLPTRPNYRGERADADSQLVRDGHADAARAQVEREQPAGGRGRIRKVLRVRVAVLFQLLAGVWRSV